MPQILYKYSSNIAISELEKVSLQIHYILVKILPTKIENCISSFLEINDFKIANNENIFDGFIQCEIKILPGRSDEIKTAACNAIIALLTKEMESKHMKIKFFVSIDEQPQNYLSKII